MVAGGGGGSSSTAAADYVCGAAAGAANIVSGFPFDTVKVRLQNTLCPYSGELKLPQAAASVRRRLARMQLLPSPHIPHMPQLLSPCMCVCRPLARCQVDCAIRGGEPSGWHGWASCCTLCACSHAACLPIVSHAAARPPAHTHQKAGAGSVPRPQPPAHRGRPGDGHQLRGFCGHAVLEPGGPFGLFFGAAELAC